VTCYDFSFAKILNHSEVDMILVGHSGGMVVLGYDDTSPVTVEEMLMVTAAVRRGAPEKFVVGDLPKGSYEASDEIAIQVAMRFVKEAGCDAVKLEGAGRMVARIRALAEVGIPVIGHIGLTPQTAANFGGYSVQGRTKEGRTEILRDAKAIEEAGAFAILVEATPPETGSEVSRNLSVPVFGIGAGPHLDGQLLILHDMLGLFSAFRPKFAKCFVPDVIDSFRAELSSTTNVGDYGRQTRADGLGRLTELAIGQYVQEVRSHVFPAAEHLYTTTRK